jgi:hypothetical protein
MLSRGAGGLEPVEHLLGVDEAGLLLDEAAVREDGEVGDAAHVVAGGELRVGFGVDLEDEAAAGDFACGVLDVRGGHAAGTTPGGPEVDEHGDAGVGDDVVEERGVGGDGLGDGRERLLAGAAAAGVGEVSCGDAVFGAAAGAGADDRHGDLRQEIVWHGGGSHEAALREKHAARVPGI